ncbi:protein peste [Culex quinquefasciatus]|uniref:protein peste n=1 Tax=Culex quinquefasciatus TaxID=7176 RepID=UPI0018E36B7B|nr:protein peste [Culex quinquefasciatus]
MPCSKIYCVTVVGAVVAVAGAIFALFWGDIFDAVIVKEKSLTPTSKAFKLWKRPPFQAQWQMTLFNCTNAVDFLENRARRPKVVEVGPYTFTESSEKIEVRFNTKNSTVSFRKRTMFAWDEDQSQALPEEPITNLNMVALAAANRGRYSGYTMQRGISFTLFSFGQKVFVTKTAAELLFDGYPEPLIKGLEDVMSFIGEDMGLDGRFSWFHTLNGTKKAYGYFNMDTGSDDSSQYGLVRAWNYRLQSTNADGTACGKYQGFTGELFPTKIRKDRVLRIFTPEACRVLTFEFEQEVDVYGVRAFRFVGTARTLDNGSAYPAETGCYTAGSESFPAGVMNLTECRMGAPAFASFPHFYLADPFYRGQVEGMRPDRERHQSFFVVEPISGIVLNATIAIQINALLRPSSNVALYQDSPTAYVPMIWFSKRFQLAEEDVLKLKAQLQVSELGYFGGFAVAAAGALIALASVVMGLIFKNTLRRQQKERPTTLVVPSKDPRGDYQPVEGQDKIKV